MKEIIVLACILLLAVAGYVFFVGRSHTVNFRYHCNIEIPWYEAIFLDIQTCPRDCQPKP